MLPKQAYSEVYYLITKMPEEMKNKIPENLINEIRNNMDKDYNVNPEQKSIEDLKLLDETKKILSVLYTDYITTNEEREIIKAKERSIKKQNIEKMPNIRVRELFVDEDKDNEKIEKSIIKIENDKWYKRIHKFFIKIFKIKK